MSIESLCPFFDRQSPIWRAFKKERAFLKHQEGPSQNTLKKIYLNVISRIRYSPVIVRMSGYVMTILSESFWFSSPHFFIKAAYSSWFGCMSAVSFILTTKMTLKSPLDELGKAQASADAILKAIETLRNDALMLIRNLD